MKLQNQGPQTPECLPLKNQFPKSLSQNQKNKLSSFIFVSVSLLIFSVPLFSIAQNIDARFERFQALTDQAQSFRRQFQHDGEILFVMKELPQPVASRLIKEGDGQFIAPEEVINDSND